jgi:hypothetical protein
MRLAVALLLALACILAGCGSSSVDEKAVRGAYAKIVRQCSTPVARQSLTAADDALNTIITQYGHNHDGRAALTDGGAPIPLREVLRRTAGVFRSDVPGPRYGEPRCSPGLADKIDKLLAKPQAS